MAPALASTLRISSLTWVDQPRPKWDFNPSRTSRSNLMPARCFVTTCFGRPRAEFRVWGRAIFFLNRISLFNADNFFSTVAIVLPISDKDWIFTFIFFGFDNIFCTVANLYPLVIRDIIIVHTINRKINLDFLNFISYD